MRRQRLEELRLLEELHHFEAIGCLPALRESIRLIASSCFEQVTAAHVREVANYRSIELGDEVFFAKAFTPGKEAAVSLALAAAWVGTWSSTTCGVSRRSPLSKAGARTRCRRSRREAIGAARPGAARRRHRPRDGVSRPGRVLSARRRGGGSPPPPRL